MGLRVAKVFADGLTYQGTVKAFFSADETMDDCDLYEVHYDDGDQEDLPREELEHCLALYEQLQKDQAFQTGEKVETPFGPATVIDHRVLRDGIVIVAMLGWAARAYLQSDAVERIPTTKIRFSSAPDNNKPPRQELLRRVTASPDAIVSNIMQPQPAAGGVVSSSAATKFKSERNNHSDRLIELASEKSDSTDEGPVLRRGTRKRKKSLILLLDDDDDDESRAMPISRSSKAKRTAAAVATYAKSTRTKRGMPGSMRATTAIRRRRNLRMTKQSIVWSLVVAASGLVDLHFHPFPDH